MLRSRGREGKQCAYSAHFMDKIEAHEQFFNKNKSTLFFMRECFRLACSAPFSSCSAVDMFNHMENG